MMTVSLTSHLIILCVVSITSCYRISYNPIEQNVVILNDDPIYDLIDEHNDVHIDEQIGEQIDEQYDQQIVDLFVEKNESVENDLHSLPKSTEDLNENTLFNTELETEYLPPSQPNICANKFGYIEHEYNCSLFYSCENNLATAGVCPPSMWFDPNNNGKVLCNLPEVICAANNSVCNCATEYPPAPPDPLIEDSVTCLMDNKFHLTASTVDCGRYFVCYNENVFRMECRQGFHYNPKDQLCDYPEEVNCKIIDPDCPKEGIRFLPHPERCDAFLFCIHGYKTMQSCPFYHFWDNEAMSCKRQDEVSCSVKAK